MAQNYQRSPQLIRAGLGMASLVTLACSAVVAASLPAQAEGESARPVCESLGGGRSRCAYSSKNPAPQPYKYYEGQVSSGNIPSGQGLLVYTNDDRYQGSLRNGVPSGRGMFVFKDNSRYEGEMDRGYPNGSGTFTLSNGDRYTASGTAIPTAVAPWCLPTAQCLAVTFFWVKCAVMAPIPRRRSAARVISIAVSCRAMAAVASPVVQPIAAIVANGAMASPTAGGRRC
jgi:hypothetical protein